VINTNLPYILHHFRDIAFNRSKIAIYLSNMHSVQHTETDNEHIKTHKTRMWANAQPDGRPAKHRWRPLFNAAKFG